MTVIVQVMTPDVQMGASGMGMQMSMESPAMGMQMGMTTPGGMSSGAASPSALTPSVSSLHALSHLWSFTVHAQRQLCEMCLHV